MFCLITKSSIPIKSLAIGSFHNKSFPENQWVGDCATNLHSSARLWLELQQGKTAETVQEIATVQPRSPTEPNEEAQRGAQRLVGREGHLRSQTRERTESSGSLGTKKWITTSDMTYIQKWNPKNYLKKKKTTLMTWPYCVDCLVMLVGKKWIGTRKERKHVRAHQVCFWQNHLPYNMNYLESVAHVASLWLCIAGIFWIS